MIKIDLNEIRLNILDNILEHISQDPEYDSSRWSETLEKHFPVSCIWSPLPDEFLEGFEFQNEEEKLAFILTFS